MVLPTGLSARGFLSPPSRLRPRSPSSSKRRTVQNAGKLSAICPELKVGVYSAGLDRRDTDESVIVAGIQSVYNKMEMFRPFDLIMVDEVHMVPPENAPENRVSDLEGRSRSDVEDDRKVPREGRYRTFLESSVKANPHVRLIGWT